jgi:kinesin family protein C1
MLGPDGGRTLAGGDAAQRGAIPRAVEMLFARAGALKEQHWTYSFTASMLEIYNEKLRDLLPQSKKAAADGEHKILYKDGQCVVSNL